MLSKHMHACHAHSERSTRLSFDLTSGSSHSSPRELKYEPGLNELESDTEIMLEGPSSPSVFERTPSFYSVALSAQRARIKSPSVSVPVYPPHWVQPLSSLPAQTPKIPRSRITYEPDLAPSLATTGPTNYRFPMFRRASTAETDIKQIFSDNAKGESRSSAPIKRSESVTDASR